MNIDLNIIFTSIIKRKSLFLKCLFLSLIISVLIFFIIPKKYSSSIHLLPEKNQPSTGLTSAIGLLGLDSSSFNQSGEQLVMPDIVDELLKSRSFEKKLLRETIVIDEMGNKEIILNYFKKNNDLENTIENDSKNIISSITNIKKDIETGIYSISITSDNPYVSFHLCNALYETLTKHRFEILGAFNKEKEKFLIEKIKMANAELEVAEKDLLNFVSQNSNYQNSPSLNLVYQNKLKNVELLSNLFWKYRQDIEILELENISIIGGLVIVDKPYIDLDPVFPRLNIILTIFILINIFLAIPYILYIDFFKKV